MDEPFSALDPLIRREMQDLLRSLQRDLHKTIVFVTHDLNEAMRLGDRIMVMRGGRVVQMGTGPEILSSPANDYVSDFISDVDRSRVLTADSIMHEPLVTATIQDEPREVLRRLGDVEGCGAYVLDDRGRIVGIARAEDLAQAVGQGHQSLQDSLVDEYAKAGADTALVDLCQLVGRHSVPLAITDPEGRLLGVLPRAALLGALANPKAVQHD